MDDKVNAQKQEPATPSAQQGGGMQDVQDMIENSLKNAIERLQRKDTKRQMDDSSPDAADGDDAEALQAQADLNEIKTMVGTLQKFIDNLNLMIAQLEGTGSAYGQDEEKFLDDYIATADSILEIAAFSSKDNITGLSNRYGFDDRMMLEWHRSQRHESPLSLLIFDVVVSGYNEDELTSKQRNDMLRAISKALKNSIKRSTDFIAHWSEDEFAALLPVTGIDGAMSVANRITEEIGDIDIPAISEHGGKMLVFIGVNVQTPKHGDHLTNYTDKVCSALNNARESGESRIIVVES